MAEATSCAVTHLEHVLHVEHVCLEEVVEWPILVILGDQEQLSPGPRPLDVWGNVPWVQKTSGLMKWASLYFLKSFMMYSLIIATNLNLFHINHEFVFFPVLYQHLPIKNLQQYKCTFVLQMLTFHSFWIKILKERRKDANSVILNSSIKSKWIHFHFFFLFMYPCHWWKQKPQYLLLYLSS